MMYFITLLIIAFSWYSCSAEFVDEMEVYENKCFSEDQFACLDGGCINRIKYCDNHPDCADGSDENFCFNHTPDELLCNVSHQFMCSDKKTCIPLTWLCNQIQNCNDGSDEINCSILSAPPVNATCKGFTCGDGKCISNLWTCDGHYDCDDESDEDILKTCMHTILPHTVNDGQSCERFPPFGPRRYLCDDNSFCLFEYHMCNGIPDCKDASDEGPFCKNWKTMCNNSICHGNDTVCTPERTGPKCICSTTPTLKRYNYTSKMCEDVDECREDRPKCSHYCANIKGAYKCACEIGYTRDLYGYLCFAQGPEALLFFSTNNEIRYVKLNTKQLVTVATGIKQSHGVTYDGQHVYWVETAEGHQAIMRAQLENLQDSKEVIVSWGLEDPGDIAIDFLTKLLYVTDAKRGCISVCKMDGSICTTINTNTSHPKFITLDPKNGLMYWADWYGKPVIMKGRMDGSNPQVLVQRLLTFATGLALDAPNGRLYFVDRTVKVVKVDDGQTYSLFEEPYHTPYAIAVFENTVYWSDWTTNSLQTVDKLHGSSQRRLVVLSLKTPIYDMHIYHPVMMRSVPNPCDNNTCSHICLLSSNETRTCACPEGMRLEGNQCIGIPNYRPEYLIVGGGSAFARVQYNRLGNPETHSTHFNIGRVNAMAYDAVKDVLFVYDGQRKAITHLNMSEFILGVPQLLVYNGLENVVDMEYDWVTDTLYVLDAGRGFVEVVSVRNEKRALLFRFNENEMPLSFCLLHDYGIMLVAVMDTNQNDVHIDSISLDGSDRKNIVDTNLKGERIIVRYSPHMDTIFVADEGNGVIDTMHPAGTGREHYRSLMSTVTNMAVTENLVFWTDRRTQRLFWSDMHETMQKIRRIEMSIFPNTTLLYIQPISAPPNPKSPLFLHPCRKISPCSDICVQSPMLGYKCLCSPGLLLVDGKCVSLVVCRENELYCHNSNVCYMKSGRCDGKKDCLHGEDEERCDVTPNVAWQPSHNTQNVECSYQEIPCNGSCINRNQQCIPGTRPTVVCSENQFQCESDKWCIERRQVCDKHPDCADGSDEAALTCDTLQCTENEFMCVSGACIMKSWHCDGENDCDDGSDEFFCPNRTCTPGMFRCRSSECIKLRKRCDRKMDCFDGSDEEDCEEPVVVHQEVTRRCSIWEYTCEFNTSICLPHTARCNAKIECPGGTDEHGCEFNCSPHGLFACKQEAVCIAISRVCNGKKECKDGSDETPEACRTVRSNSHLYPVVTSSPSECRHGFLCENGQCLEWREVCDNTPNCFDMSDENGLCLTSCEKKACSHKCQPTPKGPMCICPSGYKVSVDGHSCEDIDECENHPCTQLCQNTLGSFHCLCRRGLALRSDGHTCKVIKGNMSILYVSGNSIRSIFADGSGSIEYNDSNIALINDMDLDIRRNYLYLTSAEAGKLLEVNGTSDVVTVTNIGRPTQVAVEWITGNVYFVDKSPTTTFIRVCNIARKKCAKLQRMPSGVQVTALEVSPAKKRIYYCATRSLESVVWSATLSGRILMDITTVHNCTGLAVDSFANSLYIAEYGPAYVTHVDLKTNVQRIILSDDPQLQAPNSLALFEDRIYFLVANTFKLSRCLLYGNRKCEPYVYRLFDANTFVIRHDSVQRDDVENQCDGFVCSNVCVLDDNGPKCVCEDGTVAKNSECAPVRDRMDMPLFNGWTSETLNHHISLTLTVFLILVFVIAVGAVIYFRCGVPRQLLKRCRRDNVPIKFQNIEEPSVSFHQTNNTVELQIAEPVNEFVNPLQYKRYLWQNVRSEVTRPPNFQNFQTFTMSLTSGLPQDLPIIDSEDDGVQEVRHILKK